jgi:hypothetical protein
VSALVPIHWKPDHDRVWVNNQFMDHHRSLTRSGEAVVWEISQLVVSREDLNNTRAQVIA